MVDSIPWHRLRFAERTPLPEVWRATSGEFRPAVLEYWLAWSARDPWTFEQLRELAAALMRDGEELPSELLSFTVEFLQGERAPPSRSGPQTDFHRDHRAFRTFVCMTELLGLSQREAAQFIGERMRPPLSVTGVLSAVRRARRV